MKIVSKSYKAIMTLVLCLCAAGIGFQSCNNEEFFYLDAYGPSEVERGGEIYFVGTALDKVERIILLDETIADGEPGREIVFERADFTSASSEKITLHIPVDYPLDRKGPAKIIYSGGVYITMNAFMVLNVAMVSPIWFTEEPMGPDNPLEPGKWIAVTGKVLLAVDSVIIENGDGNVVSIYKDDFLEHTDQIIKFKLPAEVGTGATFKLKVPGRSRVGESYLELEGELFLPVPSAVNFKSDDDDGIIKVCKGMKFSVERFDRLEYDKETKEVNFLIGSLPATGTVDEATKTISVDIPDNISGGEKAITLNTFGKVPVESKATFSIQTFEPNLEQLYQGVPLPAKNDFDIIFINGINLCAVQKAEYRTTSVNSANPDGVMQTYTLSTTITPNTPFVIVGDQLRLFLVTYKRGGEVILHLKDNSTKIELPVPKYVGMPEE